MQSTAYVDHYQQNAEQLHSKEGELLVGQRHLIHKSEKWQYINCDHNMTKSIEVHALLRGLCVRK